MDGEAEAAVELVVEDKPLEDVIVTEGTSTFSKKKIIILF